MVYQNTKKIHKIGESQGVILDLKLLKYLGITDKVNIKLDGDKIVIQKYSK